jgi:hypothetical protein
MLECSLFLRVISVLLTMHYCPVPAPDLVPSKLITRASIASGRLYIVDEFISKPSC